MSKAAARAAAWRRVIVALTGIVLVGAAFAQVDATSDEHSADRLFLDFTEWDYAELGLGVLPCDAGGDVGLCLPIVHMFDQVELDACLRSGDPSACAADAVVRSPFIVPEVAEEFAAQVAEAYRALRRGFAEAADRGINDHSLPPVPGSPCHTPSACFFGAPPVPDLIVCAQVRAQLGIAREAPALLARYYLNIERIVNTYLPFYVRSGSVYPLLESVVSPTMDITGDVGAFLASVAAIDDVEDVISQAYRLQSLIAFTTGRATPTIPHLLTQIEHEQVRGRSIALPGIHDYEQDKRARDAIIDLDSLSFGGSWVDGIRTLLPGLLPEIITDIISDTIASSVIDAITSGADLTPIIRDALAGLITTPLAPDVLDDLTQRISAVLSGATPDTDISGLIAYALNTGLALLAPGIFTDDAFIDDFLTGIGLDEIRDRVLDNDTDRPPTNSDTATPPAQPIDEDGALRISNPFLYEHIGYAGFTQVTPQHKNVILLHWNGFVPVPGIRVYCGIGPIKIPLPLRFPAPAPAIIPNVATPDYITVPEGYPIPHTNQALSTSILINLLFPPPSQQQE